YLMLAQTESVGLCLFQHRVINWLAPHTGTSQLSRVVEAIEKTSPNGESGLAPAIHETAERLDRRALVIIVSDLLLPPAQFREGLAHLRHDRHEVICLRVLDRDEIEFPFRRWSRFRGLEGERAALVEPALARKTYLEHFRKHQEELEDQCHAQHVELHTFVTDQPLGDALSRFLRSRH